LRWVWVALCCLFAAGGARAFAPRAVSWSDHGNAFLAVLGDNRLHVARVAAEGIIDLVSLPATGVTALAVAPRHSTPTVLAAYGTVLLQMNFSHQNWEVLGYAPATIREIHPAPDDTSRALLLTGDPEHPAAGDGAVWLADWNGLTGISRVPGVKDDAHPWQLWWMRAQNQQCLACATDKTSPAVTAKLNGMYVFSWNGHEARPRWLGTRLSRPYLDATYADLHHDGQWRMAAVEVAEDGRRSLAVYRAVGFGFEGEWRSDPLPGLERVAAFTTLVLGWGVTPPAPRAVGN